MRLIVLGSALAALAACGVADTLRSVAGGGDDAVVRTSPITAGERGAVEEKQAGFFRSGSKFPQPKAPITANDCTTLQSGGPTDGCLTAEIRCGETIVGHTVGGTKAFDSAFYEKNFCTPSTTNHDGGDERVYRLRMPEGEWHAIVTLDTPCADLDLAAILWNEEQCPGPAAMINRCEMFPKKGNTREQVELVSQRESTWYIAVEGKDAEEGAFGLSVQCFPGLY